MFRKIKKMYNNKPWKDVKTRKISFTYCVIFGTLIILFGAIMISFDKNFDTSTWMSEALNFCKFIVGTGTCIVLSANISQVVKILKDYSLDEDDSKNESED